jgi:hypothetical protein
MQPVAGGWSVAAGGCLPWPSRLSLIFNNKISKLSINIRCTSNFLQYFSSFF